MIRIWIAFSIMAITATVGADDSGAKTANPFFAFDNGVGRGTWTIEQQAETLARLGYAGIGYSGTVDLDERLKTFDEHGLRIFNLYVPCHVDSDPPFGEDLRAAIERLKGTDVALWLTVQGKTDDPDRAAAIVGEIADLAADAGIRVALYPHAGFYVADIEDALAIVRKADRDNLGLTFNLCHELKAGNEARFTALLEQALPHLFFVSINGADHEGGWDRLIQPLGHGAFDLKSLLTTLGDLGYTGPVGLQCYQVPGDTVENLQHNIAQWKMLRRLLKGE